tara:strand:- start:481 stop:993 length:513 start_codon:yes stop_codon:yes gene_type:complete
MEYENFDFRECFIPYLNNDCINIIIKFKYEMEYFEALITIFHKILYQKNKKRIEFHQNIDLNDVIFHLNTYHHKFIEKYNFHLYIYDDYKICNNIRLNYNDFKSYSNNTLYIHSIQKINDRRILLILDEDYTKLDNITKISKGFKFYIKKCTNFLYIKMNIYYIKLCHRT